jgi:hypothetical protein
MNREQDLMQRLAVSKKIMEKSENIKGGNGLDTRKINMPQLDNFQPAQASYNIPQEFLSEQSTTSSKSYHDPTKPLEEDRIINSKLPDEIKRLMIEQPIVQPSSMNGTAQISEEVIQGAQRLMKKDKNSDFQTEQSPKQKIVENNISSNINLGDIKSMIRDVVRDTVRDVVREELKQAGMIVESTQNSNESIQFKVGQHLFVGRVTKIKKLQK